jgi:hypothetical protein
MTRTLRLLALLAALVLPAASARAQEPPPGAPGTEESGNPVPGYVATGMLGFGAIFVLCKSARR